MLLLKVGSEARVVATKEVGIVIAPPPHSGWTLYRAPTKGRIKVYSLLFESGEVRFFTSDALEPVS
jgi:hypothetical protein